MLEEIKKDIQERLNSCTETRQPSGDEISMAWLLWEIERLNKIIKSQYLAQHNRFENGGKLTLEMPTWLH